MNLFELDDFIISAPISQERRIEYLKIFLNNAFLRGIDKGTNLEISRRKKIELIHLKRLENSYQLFLDDIFDLINIAEKKVFRQKYRGRYNYYKSKKPHKIKTNNIKKSKVNKANFQVVDLW